MQKGNFHMSIDILAEATNEAERPNFIFGQCEVSGQYVQFVDKKKVIWTEHDDLNKRELEVTMVVNPIEETGLTKLMTRQFIANNYGEFATIVWPSLKNCGLKQLNELNKKFVKMEIVEARKYKDKTTGELKSATTFKFHGVYADKAACVAELHKSGQPVSTLNVAPSSNPGDPMAIDMTPNASNLERENSKAFLPMLIKAAGGDTNQLKTLIASMSPLNKYFTVDSPEVVELLKAA